MANYLGFIDETGALQKDPQQRFFGLGLLKLERTAPLYDDLCRLTNKIVSEFTHLPKPFEFKFNNINRHSYGFYKQLLELYFSFTTGAFCAFVIDKQAPDFNLERYFKDPWEAYISYSRLLVAGNVTEKDKICILADYLSKPKSSSKYYEIEVAKAKTKGTNPIYNVCMLESHASLFIQLVDVLIGCVVLDFRMKWEAGFKPNQFKHELVKLIREKLKTGSLAGKVTRRQPNYFSVWPFNPSSYVYPVQRSVSGSVKESRIRFSYFLN